MGVASHDSWSHICYTVIYSEIWLHQFYGTGSTWQWSLNLSQDGCWCQTMPHRYTKGIERFLDLDILKKIRGKWKAGSCRELKWNQDNWLIQLVFCHWVWQMHTTSSLYKYCTRGYWNAWVMHPVVTQYMCRQNSIRGWPNFSPSGEYLCWVILSF